MRFLLRQFLLLIAVAICCPLQAAPPPTKPLILDQDITGTLVLPKTKQPHQVAHSITIRPTGKLLVERGAVIQVAGGAEVVLMGPIEVFGDGDDRVVFTARDQHRAWSGFTVGEKASLELSDLTVALADFGFKHDVGRSVKEAHLHLKNSLIVDCETGVKLGPAGQGRQHTFENCRILRCRENGFIIGYYGKLKLDHVSVLGCGHVGVFLADRNTANLQNCVIAGNKVGLKTNRGAENQVTLERCAFVKQQEFHVDHVAPKPIQARGCFWGDTEPARIARGIQDGYDLPARGQVDFAEFLTEPPKGIGATIPE